MVNSFFRLLFEGKDTMIFFVEYELSLPVLQ